MKKKIKIIYMVFSVCLITGVIFISIGYTYLNSNTKPADKNVSSVPYYNEEPESAGVVFEISGQKTYFYLDFYYKTLSVVYNAEQYENGDEIFGYPIDYRIVADTELLAWIIDCVGGIEFNNEGEVFRYTGVQVVDLLSTSSDYNSFKRQVIQSIIEKISQNGFQRNEFLYIIENTTTNLTVPDCYYWCDYIKEICKFVKTVN